MKEDGKKKKKKGHPNFFRKFFKPPFTINLDCDILLVVDAKQGNLRVATRLNFDN